MTTNGSGIASVPWEANEPRLRTAGADRGQLCKGTAASLLLGAQWTLVNVY